MTCVSQSALLIVDMLTRYDFRGARSLLPTAPDVVERIARCREFAAAAAMPVVFANDIYDRFSGSREALFREAASGAHGDLVKPLEPAPDDCFLHKGQHSAFYGTPLAHLLHEWEIETVVLTGQVTEQCILYTALDAHVRHYSIEVLRDCVLSIESDLGDAALRMMESNMGAEVLGSESWRS